MSTLFYISLGVLVTFMVLSVYRRHLKEKLSIRTRSFSFLAIVFIAFGLAWAETSIHEDELQAALMGILVFGGVGAVFAMLAYKGLRKAKPFDAELVNKSESTNAISTKTTIAAVLVILVTILLPVTLLVKIFGNIAFDTQKMTNTIVDHVISDESLPGVIKKGTVYQIIYDSDSLLLEQRAVLAMLGSIDNNEWIELFDMVAPEDQRAEMVLNTVGSMHAWLDNNLDFPQLEIPVEKYVSNLKTNAENIVQWIYSAALFPACTDEQIAEYQSGIFRDSLLYLIGSKPPEELRHLIAPHASKLLVAQIDSAGIPQSIQLEDRIQAEITADQMRVEKKKASAMRTILQNAWIIPVIFLLIAFSLVVRSIGSLAKWLSWTFCASGMLGVFLSLFLLNPTGIIGKVLVKLSTEMPPPALAVIKNLMEAISHQAAGDLIISTGLVFLTGVVSLLVLYRLPLKSLVIRKQEQHSIEFQNV